MANFYLSTNVSSQNTIRAHIKSMGVLPILPNPHLESGYSTTWEVIHTVTVVSHCHNSAIALDSCVSHSGLNSTVKASYVNGISTE